MGLSCKQIYGDGLNWCQSLLQNPVLEIPVPREQPKVQGKRQQQQHRQQEALRCPRCDSTNTKFCYYNNYNQSQPRHFCKTCKRHWTKGGTLRNVPVGGGRKNKRLKRTTLTEEEHIPHNTTTIDQQFLPTLTDKNNTISGILYNSNPLLRPPNCPNNNNNNTDTNTNMSANEFMGSAPLSPLLSLPGFHFQKTTNPYEDSSYNMLPDPFCENRKQNQLLFPLAPAEDGQVPSDNHVESMPWQLSATSFADTVPDTSFWNTGDIWALLSNVGIGSDVQQEETDIVEGEELD